jgi:hypothetical protein
MPTKLKHIFEKEYEKKGKTKKEADRIFYAFENKHKSIKKRK